MSQIVKPKSFGISNTLSNRSYDYQRSQYKKKLEPDLRMKMVNQSKYKGSLIGNQVDRNFLIDTDCDINDIKAKGVTQLIYYSSSKKIINSKPISRTREQLGSFLSKGHTTKKSGFAYDQNLKKELQKKQPNIMSIDKEINFQSVNLQQSDLMFNSNDMNQSPLHIQNQYNTCREYPQISLNINELGTNYDELNSSQKRENKHHEPNLHSESLLSLSSGYDVTKTHQNLYTSYSTSHPNLGLLNEIKADGEEKVYLKDLCKEEKEWDRYQDFDTPRSINNQESIRKYNISKIELIQKMWKKYIKARYMNHKIVLIQALWRGHWVRANLYDVIQQYYIGWAFINYTKNYISFFKKIYWEELLNILQTRPSTLHKSVKYHKINKMFFNDFEKEEIPIYDQITNEIIPTNQNSQSCRIVSTKAYNKMFQTPNTQLEKLELEFEKSSSFKIEKTEFTIDKRVNPGLLNYEELYYKLLKEVEELKAFINNKKKLMFEKNHQFELLQLPEKLASPNKNEVHKDKFANIKEHQEVSFTFNRIEKELMLSLSKNNNIHIPKSSCSKFPQDIIKISYLDQFKIDSSYYQNGRVLSSFNTLLKSNESLFYLESEPKINYHVKQPSKDISLMKHSFNFDIKAFSNESVIKDSSIIHRKNDSLILSNYSFDIIDKLDDTKCFKSDIPKIKEKKIILQGNTFSTQAIDQSDPDETSSKLKGLRTKNAKSSIMPESIPETRLINENDSSLQLEISNQVGFVSFESEKIIKKTFNEIYHSTSITIPSTYESKSTLNKFASSDSLSLYQVSNLNNKPNEEQIQSTNENVGFNSIQIENLKKFDINSLSIESLVIEQNNKIQSKNSYRWKKRKKSLIKPISQLKSQTLMELDQTDFVIEEQFVITIEGEIKHLDVLNEEIDQRLKISQKWTDFAIERIDLNSIGEISQSSMIRKQKPIKIQKQVGFEYKFINLKRKVRNVRTVPIQTDAMEQNEKDSFTDLSPENCLEMTLLNGTCKEIQARIGQILISQEDSFDIINNHYQMNENYQEVNKPSYATKQYKSRSKGRASLKSKSINKDQYLFNNWVIESNYVEIAPVDFSMDKKLKESNYSHIKLNTVESFCLPTKSNTAFSQSFFKHKVSQSSPDMNELLNLPLRSGISLPYNIIEKIKEKTPVNMHRTSLSSSFNKFIISGDEIGNSLDNQKEDNILSQSKEKEKYLLNDLRNSKVSISNYSFKLISKDFLIDNEGKELDTIKNSKYYRMKSQTPEDSQLPSLLTDTIFTHRFKRGILKNDKSSRNSIQSLQTNSFEINIKPLYEYRDIVNKMLSDYYLNKRALMTYNQQDEFEFLSKYEGKEYLNSQGTHKQILFKSILPLRLKAAITKCIHKYGYSHLIEQLEHNKEINKRKSIVSIGKYQDSKLLKYAFKKWKINYISLRILESILRSKWEEANKKLKSEMNQSFAIAQKKTIDLIYETYIDFQLNSQKKQAILNKENEHSIEIISLKKEIDLRIQPIEIDFIIYSNKKLFDAHEKSIQTIEFKKKDDYAIESREYIQVIGKNQLFKVEKTIPSYNKENDFSYLGTYHLITDIKFEKRNEKIIPSSNTENSFSYMGSHHLITALKLCKGLFEVKKTIPSSNMENSFSYLGTPHIIMENKFDEKEAQESKCLFKIERTLPSLNIENSFSYMGTPRLIADIKSNERDEKTIPSSSTDNSFSYTGTPRLITDIKSNERDVHGSKCLFEIEKTLPSLNTENSFSYIGTPRLITEIKSDERDTQGSKFLFEVEKIIPTFDIGNSFSYIGEPCIITDNKFHERDDDQSYKWLFDVEKTIPSFNSENVFSFFGTPHLISDIKLNEKKEKLILSYTTENVFSYLGTPHSIIENKYIEKQNKIIPSLNTENAFSYLGTPKLITDIKFDERNNWIIPSFNTENTFSYIGTPHIITNMKINERNVENAFSYIGTSHLIKDNLFNERNEKIIPSSNMENVFSYIGTPRSNTDIKLNERDEKGSKCLFEVVKTIPSSNMENSFAYLGMPHKITENKFDEKDVQGFKFLFEAEKTIPSLNIENSFSYIGTPSLIADIKLNEDDQRCKSVFDFDKIIPSSNTENSFSYIGTPHIITDIKLKEIDIQGSKCLFEVDKTIQSSNIENSFFYITTPQLITGKKIHERDDQTYKSLFEMEKTIPSSNTENAFSYIATSRLITDINSNERDDQTCKSILNINSKQFSIQYYGFSIVDDYNRMRNHFKTVLKISHNKTKYNQIKMFYKWYYRYAKRNKVIINIKLTKYNTTTTNSETNVIESQDRAVSQMKKGISLIKIINYLYKRKMNHHFSMWKRPKIRTSNRKQTIRISNTNYAANMDINEQIKEMIKKNINQRSRVDLYGGQLLKCINTIDNINKNTYKLHYLLKWLGPGKEKQPSDIISIKIHSMIFNIEKSLPIRSAFKHWNNHITYPNKAMSLQKAILSQINRKTFNKFTEVIGRIAESKRNNPICALMINKANNLNRELIQLCYDKWRQATEDMIFKRKQLIQLTKALSVVEVESNKRIIRDYFGIWHNLKVKAKHSIGLFLYLYEIKKTEEKQRELSVNSEKNLVGYFSKWKSASDKNLIKPRICFSSGFNYKTVKFNDISQDFNTKAKEKKKIKTKKVYKIKTKSTIMRELVQKYMQNSDFFKLRTYFNKWKVKPLNSLFNNIKWRLIPEDENLLLKKRKIRNMLENRLHLEDNKLSRFFNKWNEIINKKGIMVHIQKKRSSKFKRPKIVIKNYRIDYKDKIVYFFSNRLLLRKIFKNWKRTCKILKKKEES